MTYIASFIAVIALVLAIRTPSLRDLVVRLYDASAQEMRAVKVQAQAEGLKNALLSHAQSFVHRQTHKALDKTLDAAGYK